MFYQNDTNLCVPDCYHVLPDVQEVYPQTTESSMQVTRTITRKAFTHDRNPSVTSKHEWLTPPWLLARLGSFDLDPCSPVPSDRPWPTAGCHYDVTDNGLVRPWFGRVWCNPPYDSVLCGRFLQRCANHGNAVALIFARVETANWFKHIWGAADAVLFIKGRLTFHNADGSAPRYSAGAPSALVAYGTRNSQSLRHCGIPGHFVSLKRHIQR